MAIGNGAAGTINDILADKKTYYKCPGCDKQVYAYGALVGVQCANVCHIVIIINNICCTCLYDIYSVRIERQEETSKMVIISTK